MVAALVFTTGVVAAFPPEDVAKELIKYENEWAKAEVAGNAAVLEKQLTADYTYTTQDGQVVSRADLLASVKSTKYETYTVSDIKARAMATQPSSPEEATKGTQNGKPIDQNLSFTDTWVKQNGQWLCAATHVSGK